jgi:hypothetical protein
MFSRSVFFVLTSVLLVSGAFSQNTSSSISGSVSDPSKAVLPGAVITVTNIATGEQRTLMTDSTGLYAVPGLPVGTYRVSAEFSPFRTETRNVTVQVAVPQRVDFVMVLDAAREVVTVSLAGAQDSTILRPTSAEVGEVIDNHRMVSLPLNGRRFTDLMLLSDNVVTEPKGTRGAALNNAGATVAIAGQRGGHNMYFLDGVSITDQYFNNLGVSVSVDAVQEFNIQKSIYPAEYGGKASAAISAATKAGTNAFHGSLFEFFRNSALDSRNYFQKGPQTPLRQNQFGGALGGPLRENKTWFFVNAEALRERRSLTNTFSMPTEAVREGNFAGLAPIYDPLSTDPVTGARQVFANNSIPVTRIDGVAREFLKKVPLATLPGNVQNLQATPLSTNSNTQFTTRLDHRIGEADSLFARVTWSDSDTFRPFGSSDLNETLVPGFGTNIGTRTRNFAIGHTHLFTPTVIHELRFGVLQVSGGQSLENEGASFAERAGLRGISTDPAKFGYPAVNFSGAYNSMGDPARVVSRDNLSFDLFSNTTWIKGSHTVKFGAYFFRLHFNPKDSPNARGAFTFTPRFTSSVAGAADGNAFADFLLGFPSSAAGGIGRGEEHGRTNWIHAYIQDDWRMTRNVTVNAGLRYEINGHMTETGNRLSNIQQDRLVIASDDDGNIAPEARALLPLIPIPWVTSKEAGYHRSLLRPGYVRMAPRLGIAWTPGGRNTVIRAGFGLFFNQWAYSVQTALFQNLPFYQNKNVTTAADLKTPSLTLANILDSASTSAGGGGMDQNYRSEYAESWTFSVQQQLRRDWVVEANYFGSKVVGADDTTFYNIPRPGPGSIAARRPNPKLGQLQIIHWGGYSNYHALSLKLEKRLSSRFSANANYTWSKSTDAASSPGPTFSEPNFPQDVYYRKAEEGLSSYDHRHRLALSFNVDLPGGISILGSGTFQSGAPFTVNLPNDNANIGPGPSQRPNVLGNPNIENQTPDRWFDTSAAIWEMPAAFAFGNAGRNIVFGDGYTSLDLSATKTFKLRDNLNLQLRGEFFNSLNNVNFADAPGRIAFTPSFGRYFAAENPRQIQIAAKILF